MQKQKTKKLTFSIIVINYNAYEYTYNCIKSIQKFCCNYNYEIILIDNASTDDSLTKIEDEFQEILFIKNEENYGFARACNQGIDRSSGKYLIFLNNDFVFTTDIFNRIRDKFRQHKNLGLLGFQLLNSNGTLQKSSVVFPTVTRRILQLTIIPILRNYTSTVDPKPDENDQVIDYVKGALMIVPKKLLEQLNLRFDENYFMYHEDMDFAFQLQKHGKHCLLDPTPAGIHYGMHFEDVGDEKVFLWRNKSLLYFIWKNHGRFKAIIFALINIIIFSIKYILSFNNRNHRRTYKKVIQFILECLSGKMASCSTLKNS